MKVSVNNKELFTVTDLQKQVIQHNIPKEQLDEDMQRRIQYIIMHKYEVSMKELREEWTPKLIANGITMLPVDDDAFAQLVFRQPNYQDRSARDAMEKAAADNKRAVIDTQLA
jgi:hypothetical protein